MQILIKSYYSEISFYIIIQSHIILVTLYLQTKQLETTVLIKLNILN